MTDAPETIWAASGLYYEYVDDWSEGSWSPVEYGDTAQYEGNVHYTRTDLIPALEAAAYARGLEDAAKVAEDGAGSVDGGDPWGDGYSTRLT